VKPNILLIAPNAEVCEPFKSVLEKEGFAVTATDLIPNRSPRELSLSKLNAQFSLVIILCPSSGTEQQNQPAGPSTLDALFLVGSKASSGVVQTFQNGVYHFNGNGFDPSNFAETAKELMAQLATDISHPASRIPPQAASRSAAEIPPQRDNERPATSILIGQSPQIEEVREQIKRFSQFPACPVLIIGETGTGKEIVANLLHASSPRAGKPFKPVNCGAIPEALFESQLFGHCKGAFTSATTSRKGYAEAAQDGTLFLDEIGTLKLDQQPKLLRLLENGGYLPVGETSERKTNAWIIAATNRGLEELLEKKLLRDDLFYRLKRAEIKLAPLRERPQDILPLANHFLLQFSRQFNMEPKRLSSEVEAMLIKHHWPGNVRELRNVIEGLVVGCDEQCIRAVDLPFAELAHQMSLPAEFGLTLQDAERLHIQKVVKQNHGRLRKTAKDLGITYVTLRAKLKKYGLTGDS
jgi:DNA-binding NtrC family response regulator